MAVIKKNIGTSSVEIGTLSDWGNFSLVEAAGKITGDGGDKMELVRNLNGIDFELWHESGLKMRIEIKPILLECAAELSAEVERRKVPA